MTLGDRRLLIELGAVLAIKLAIIFLLRIHFFSPAAEDSQGLLEIGASDSAREESQAANSIHKAGADKER